MHAALILIIIFGGTIVVLAIISSTILMAIKIIKGGFSRKGQTFQAEETRIIQEIYQGLSQMEKRLEAIETIILGHERKERGL